MTATSERLDKPEIFYPSEDLRTEDLFPVDEAAQMFYLSFRFAQQNEGLQRDFFRYTRFARSFWEMNDNQRRQTEEIAFDKIDKFLEHAMPHSADDLDQIMNSGAVILHGRIHRFETVVEEQKSKNMDAFQEEINSPEIYDPNWIVEQISRKMVGQDAKFQLRGRKGISRIRANVTPHSPLGNSKLSMVCYYGLAGQPTGSSIFDEMFKEVAEFYRNLGERTDLQGYLIGPHNSAYPDLAINPKTLLLDQQT